MAYEMKEGSASLFKNTRKQSENHPDYSKWEKVIKNANIKNQ